MDETQNVQTGDERRARQSAEGISSRVAQAHAIKGQMRRLEADEQALAQELKGSAPETLTRQQQRAQEQRCGKLETRRLRLLKRDDEWVRATLSATRKMNGIMPADSATESDELLWLLVDKLKLLDVLTALKPQATYVDEKTGKQVERRTMYGPLVLNLLSIISRFIGAAGGPQIRAALLTDERWMTLLGFNIAEIQTGSTRRSEGLQGKTRESKSGKFEDAGPLGQAQSREEGPRGALSSQTMEAHESALEPQHLMLFFNGVVKAMAARGYFAGQIRTVIDSTGEEVVPSFEDAGVVRKKVKVKSKARRPRALEVHVRGFKVWYLMEVETGMPLAMTLAPIQTAETVPVKELVQQAEENIAGHSRMVSMALDRGFLDGDLLWWLKHDKQINWVCPSKEKMDVTEEARERVKQAIAALRQADEKPLETAQRAARQMLSHQGVCFSERQAASGRDPLVVAEVEELKRTDFYGEGGSNSSRVHSKKFEPTALCATVVLSWPDRSRHDEEDERDHDESGKGPLVLLSEGKEAGLVRFDRYDERSLIENRVNRDGKQSFALGTTLARNEAAMWSATIFSTVALMCYRALAIEEERDAQEIDRRSSPLGILRYRRQREMQLRGWIIVVIADRYGLMPLREFAKMAGFEIL